MPFRLDPVPFSVSELLSMSEFPELDKSVARKEARCSYDQVHSSMDFTCHDLRIASFCKF